MGEQLREQPDSWLLVNAVDSQDDDVEDGLTKEKMLRLLAEELGYTVIKPPTGVNVKECVNGLTAAVYGVIRPYLDDANLATEVGQHVSWLISTVGEEQRKRMVNQPKVEEA